MRSAPLNQCSRADHPDGTPYAIRRSMLALRRASYHTVCQSVLGFCSGKFPCGTRCGTRCATPKPAGHAAVSTRCATPRLTRGIPRARTRQLEILGSPLVGVGGCGGKGQTPTPRPVEFGAPLRTPAWAAAQAPISSQALSDGGGAADGQTLPITSDSALAGQRGSKNHIRRAMA